MAATQMNVRIDSDVKVRGDAAFAEVGYSPSEAARLFWGFAARNRNCLGKLRELMAGLKDPQAIAAEDGQRKRDRAELEEWLERGPQAVNAFFAETGARQFARTFLTPEEQDTLLGDALEADAERIRLGALIDEREPYTAEGLA